MNDDGSTIAAAILTVFIMPNLPQVDREGDAMAATIRTFRKVRNRLRRVIEADAKKALAEADIPDA
jgi:hypothetical protein